MRAFVKWGLLLAAMYAPSSPAQPVVWQESSSAVIRMVPDAPDSRTAITFQLVKTCDPLHLADVVRTGFEVRVEVWGTDYCIDLVSPRTHTKALGVVPPGRYTVDFHHCEDLPSPETYTCHHHATQVFTVTPAVIRPVPFAVPATLLLLPAVLLLVAVRMLRRR